VKKNFRFVSPLINYLFFISIIFFFVFYSFSPKYYFANSPLEESYYFIGPPDTLDSLIYPISDQQITGPPPLISSPWDITPKNLKDTVIYDPSTNTYEFHQKIGNIDLRYPYQMTFDEYDEYDFQKAWQRQWHQSLVQQSRSKGVFDSLFRMHMKDDGVFGSGLIDIRPSGSAEIIFGYKGYRRDDPALTVKQRRYGNFNFDEKIQLNLIAKVGDKVNFNVRYNTESNFTFDNKIKLEYEGKEDEIIKKIEAGDVTLPLNSTLISGSQSLFGLKTQLQFGKATVTAVLSQQESETNTITVAGGAELKEFKINALDYEANKHFFISQYFYNNYNKFLERLPMVSSPVNITKIEVWITNIGPATQENRNIIAFQDIGEYNPYNQNVLPNFTPDAYLPSNRTNNLFQIINPSNIRNLNDVNSYLSSRNFNMGTDYEKIENARKLSPSEFTVNNQLGFISLNISLRPDQVLAVAYQYTVVGSDSVYQVGEFSTDGIDPPNCLVVKLLKPASVNTKLPVWNLMMKNVYSIGGYQISNEDFRLNIIYKSENLGVGAGYLTESNLKYIPLIRVLGFDRLNINGDPEPDGLFDFIDNAATGGGTINSKNGRIYFPVVEPFGKDLRSKFDDPNLANKYCFDSLYTTTKTVAEQIANKNRFTIEGSYKSSVGSEISLNAINIPQGSVKVTAGGLLLQENVDYTVDYTMGRVKIINQGILTSGVPINVTVENNTFFNFQTKTYLGAHVDYKINNNFIVGGTIIHLTEKPFSTKVNIGYEPISNTIWGGNLSYQTQSTLITKIIDKLPFVSTKDPSNISIDAEFANLIPGHNKAIGKEGNAFIDNFEGSMSSITLKNPFSWQLASIPQGQPTFFPEAADDSTLASGYNRALLSWYTIDPSVFFRNNATTPPNVNKEMLSNHYMREVLESELFPAKEFPNGIVPNLATLDLAYYPTERGPYNYDVSPTSVSAGINAKGRLEDPSTRWAGIMRTIETPNFEETNVEYIEFWLLDPFIYNPNSAGGKLYINMGDISEDVLLDHKKAFENGLPTGPEMIGVDTTQWGVVPKYQALVNSFDANLDARKYQDVGYDGLSTENEASFFNSYIQAIASIYGTGSVAYQLALNDPSSDNYHYFRGSDYDNLGYNILQRYKYYKHPDGNSPTPDMSTESYPTSATNNPNSEDINRDNTLNELERYYQYEINLRPDEMVIGENYITDIYTASVKLPNGNSEKVKWYQFKVPVKRPDKVVGNINDYTSIRFMRIFLKNWSDSVVLRFGTLDLARSQWRRYSYSLLQPGEYLPGNEQNLTTFDITNVNIEENGSRKPIPYVMPPGLEREINYGTTNLQKQNEQSLSMKVCHLIDGDARGIFKSTDYDFRYYKKIKMNVHSEEVDPLNYPLNDGDLTLFIRLGTDFDRNYYEFEIPLHPTPWGNYSSNDDSRRKIWADSVELALDKLVQLKLERNTILRSDDNANITLFTPYSSQDEYGKYTIVGNPNLAEVKVILIGIRNPKTGTYPNDDGRPKCAEVWINELRVNTFDEKGGWAATARVNMGLANIGNIMFATTMSTAGFGSIEKKVYERQLDNVTSYDLSLNLDVGKLLPENFYLRIPMHVDYSEMLANPQYNPLDPDVYLRDDLETYSTEKEVDSVKRLVQSYTQRKGINFMNVKKLRPPTAKGNPKIYDLSNFDVSFAFNQIYIRNPEIEYNKKKEYTAAIAYNYNTNPKNYVPFQKVKFLNNKYLKLIGNFNFYLLPKSISLSTDMYRLYEENRWRNKTTNLIIIEPNFIKNFTWNRNYSIKYDLTRNLRLDYTANANARIDEPPGRIDKRDSDYREKRDSIIRNITSFGRITNFNQRIQGNYTLPLTYIPILDWINASVQYTGNYMWIAAPLYKDSTGNYAEYPYGNSLQNSRTFSFNVNGNFNRLYSKIPYLKNILSPPPSRPKRDDDTTQKGPSIGKQILDNSLRFLMMIKNVSINYSVSDGNMLTGYRGAPQALGMEFENMTPGWGYVFGWQEDIRDRLVANDLFTKDTTLNIPYITNYSENLNMRATLEPIKYLSINITAIKNQSWSNREYFRYNGSEFTSYTPITTGNFSMSIISTKTAFARNAKDFSNENFQMLLDIRPDIALMVAQNSPVWNGTFVTDSLTGILYPDGYGPTSQNVLIPAFLAAYTGHKPEKYVKSIFPSIPLPNWRISYTGLNKINFFKKYFSSATLTHGYTSNYTVGSFANNPLFSDPDNDGFTTVRDALHNFLPQYEISQVSISENFNPIIGIQLNWINSLVTTVNWKKSRNVALNTSNVQITEINTNEWVVGIGYRFKDLSFDIRTGGQSRTIKSDLNIKADLSIRDNITILRRIVEEINQVSAGQRVISINLSADYQFSKNITLRAFFDQIINNPHVASQYFNTSTNFGISIRFSLAM
jgi:cell surface protein SprA